MLNKPHKILDLPNKLKHGRTASESWSLRAVKVYSFFDLCPRHLEACQRSSKFVL